MAQARTLSAAEFEQLLAHIDTRKYAVRNRCMMLLTHWAGLRIGEVACLRWSDVVTPDGAVKRIFPCKHAWQQLNKKSAACGAYQFGLA